MNAPVQPALADTALGTTNDATPTEAIEDVNQRWLAYASSHKEQSNAGFMAWISERWAAWCSLRGQRPYEPRSDADHADFDAWLMAVAS